MIAAEIVGFVKRCDWLQYGVTEVLKEGAPDGTDKRNLNRCIRTRLSKAIERSGVKAEWTSASM
jgi:hypothetical protein